MIAAARTPLSARDLVGYWKWSLVSEEDGIRRVEAETWHFAPLDTAPQGQSDGQNGGQLAGQLAGTCERSVTFMSLDGVPFACNQGLHYRLDASYRVDVAIVAAPPTGQPASQTAGQTAGQPDSAPRARAVIRETEFQVAPSPCERGRRQLTSYDAQLTDNGQLHLRWPAGQQFLRRIQAPSATREPAPVAAPGAGQNAGHEITGSWHWRSRNQKDDEVRVEAEIWQLREDPATGTVTGTFERQVTMFTESGTRYECANDTYYRYRDTYTVRGARRGTELTLSEIAVTPEKHPCLNYPERHLDAAIGQVTSDYLTLTWRGGKRQVLRRGQSQTP